MIECPKCQREWDDATTFCGECGSRLDNLGAAEDPLVNTIFHNRYRVLERIASGGFGTIYKAEHLQLGSTRALKLLHQWVASDETQIERFRREAALLDRIRGATEHVPTNYTFDRDEEHGQWYFTMEYLDGVSLNQELLQNGRMESERAVTLMRQVCAALKVVHELDDPDLGRITHRDLKPHNIMLVKKDGGETVKVLDFGIAKAEAQPGLTAVGTGPGSPGYMSPEQLAGKVDPRTDLFSAGVCFYNMVTACDPWLGKPYGEPTGETGDTLNTRVKRQPPKPPREIVPTISPAVEAVILKLLAKSAEDRYQSAADLGAELERIQLGLGLPGGGRVRISSMPAGATVVLKRGAATVHTARTPCEIGPLTPGPYEIYLRKRNCEPAKGRVKIEPDETASVEFPLKRMASQREKMSAAVSAGLESVSGGRKKLATGARRAGGRRGLLALTGVAIFMAVGFVVLQVIKPSPGNSQGSIDLAELNDRIDTRDVTELRIDSLGHIEAALAGGGTVTVDRRARGLRESLSRARDAGVHIRSSGSVRLEARLGQEVGSDVPAVSLCPEDGGCTPLSFGQMQTLEPGWYTVDSESSAWILETVSVEARIDQGTPERFEFASRDAVFLIGGSTAQFDVYVRGVSDLAADSLGSEIRRHLQADRPDSAATALGRLAQIAPAADGTESLREMTAAAYRAKAGRQHQSGRLADAQLSIEKCLDWVPAYGDCESLRAAINNELAEAARRREVAQRSDEVTIEPAEQTRQAPVEEPETILVGGDWRFTDSFPIGQDRSCMLRSAPLTIVQAGSRISGRATFDLTCGPNDRRGQVQFEIVSSQSRVGAAGSNDLAIVSRRGDDVCTYRAESFGFIVQGIVDCESGVSGTWQMSRQ